MIGSECEEYSVLGSGSYDSRAINTAVSLNIKTSEKSIYLLKCR